MKYKVEYTRTALNQLIKMDRKIVAFIVSYIEEKLVNCEDSRRYGKAVQGDLNDNGDIEWGIIVF